MDPTHEWSLLTSDEGYKLVKTLKIFRQNNLKDQD